MKEHSNCGIGLVANITNKREHQIILDGIKILNRLEHRGGSLRDNSGDGAGIMSQIPKEFFKKTLGLDTDYYLAMTFLPSDEDKRKICEDIISSTLESHNINILNSRIVPVESEILGATARLSLPHIKQFFLTHNDDNFFMYSVRKEIENKIYANNILASEFYFASFSDKTVVYKGLITPKQFNTFYTDLLDEDFKSAYVMVHQRFSTNTLPSWNLAHPFRVLEHNGEINTIAGNRNWIEAKKGDIYSDNFSKEQINKLFPLTSENNSDSSNLDGVVEFMLNTGKRLPEILTTLIPQAWENNPTLTKELKDYYKAKSLVMEPWDGPAGVISSTGDEIFATLDRNGLRPMRYTITKNQKLIISSEMGVLDTLFKDIEISGKLSTGDFIYIDLLKQKLFTKDEVILEIIKDTNSQEEIKNCIEITRDNLNNLDLNNEQENIYKDMNRFKYTKEDLNISIDFLQENSKEMVTSTTYDAPLAILDEENPRLLFDYFRQKFAQVTNPPIDSIREASVFSLTSFYGSRKNLLDHKEDRGTIFVFDSPIITSKEIKTISESSVTLSTEFDTNLELAIENLVEKAIKIAKSNKNIIISDRNTSRSIPILLITSAIHHRLVEEGLRSKVGIAVESGEAREVTHYALLIGYGADLVNPYLVEEYLSINNKDLSNYFVTIDKSINKIMSKMGISSIASYRGAKIFEAIGISRDLSDRYLGNTPSSVEGLGILEVEKEVLLREKLEYKHTESIGEYIYLRNKVKHKDSYVNAKTLFDSLVENDYDKFKKYGNLARENNISLRNMFKLKTNPIDINLVESEESIMKHFFSGAMSFGSLSKNAHENIAQAFNEIAGSSNSGEGGEDESRFNTNKVSKTKQIASGRFGVTTNFLMNADELQIKMAQGAKPGEGGHLPGAKVNDEIGMVRNTIEGIDLISPPPHHDIYSIEDLAQLIYDLKNVNTKAKVSVKLASEAGVGIIASGTVKAGADKIVISGSEGGTGAAMASSLKFAATPWEFGLSETHKVLCENNLRDLVKIQVDGSNRTGMDIVIATLLGADEYAFGSGLLMAQGCIACKRCHTNLCPTGLTTQKPELHKKYHGSIDTIKTYLRFIARETRELLALVGAKSLEEVKGQSSLLIKKEESGYKASTLDFTTIFREVRDFTPHTPHAQNINSLNTELNNSDKNLFTSSIDNTHRTFGATLSGSQTLDKFNNNISNKVDIKLNGYAGQSFGAFASENQVITLEGYGNDYVAKGLSGGTIILKTPTEVENIGCIGGNTVLYGATSGELFLNGSVGERFAVRNSGANCVVEGIGNHGCEYMTGGKVIILGQMGNNFGAGMSGGEAYILKDNFDTNLFNSSTVEYFKLNNKDLEFISTYLDKHIEYTDSKLAKSVKNNNLEFIKVASKNFLEKTDNLSEHYEF